MILKVQLQSRLVDSRTREIERMLAKTSHSRARGIWTDTKESLENTDINYKFPNWWGCQILGTWQKFREFAFKTGRIPLLEGTLEEILLIMFLKVQKGEKGGEKIKPGSYFSGKGMAQSQLIRVFSQLQMHIYLICIILWPTRHHCGSRMPQTLAIILCSCIPKVIHFSICTMLIGKIGACVCVFRCLNRA